MFSFKSTREQLMEERQRSAALQSEVEKSSADIQYIAMMTDVDLDEGVEEVNFNGEE